MNKLKEYIQSRARNPIGEHQLGDIIVYVKEELSDDIDLDRALNFISDNLPQAFLQNVDMVYVGNFPFLIAKQADALFENGAIYLSSKCPDEHTLMAELVHEIAHSFEETHADELYYDGHIEHEFLGKRRRLYEILKARGYKVKIQDFENVEYDKDFDRQLYNDIGYETLSYMVRGLFISPYAATSLREYFANAFEEFFVNDMKTVKDLTPSVYEKIEPYLE